MWHYAAKVALSAAVIVAVSEIAKRSSFWAAALASLPLTSLLAFVWLYVETGDVGRVASLSTNIFWLVLPSLTLFLLLPIMLRLGLPFLGESRRILRSNGLRLCGYGVGAVESWRQRLMQARVYQQRLT